MESATLLLLASGMGVMFGWQPMPDGSSRYEYIVQLEPELVATLEEGQSIPISSEVPDEIRPIARIRIMVGRDPLPRQQLTTTLKPIRKATEKKSLDGVIRTQYTAPPVQPTGAGRYVEQPQANQPILPPSGAPTSSNQGFAQALQNAAQPVKNLATQVKEILPPERGNGVVSSVQNATQNLGNQFRNAGETIRADAQQLFGNSGQARQTLDQAGQQVRGAIQNVGQQAQNALNQLAAPNRNQPQINTNQNRARSTASNQTILPPPGGTAPQATAGTPITPPRTRIDQPVSPTRNAPRWQSHPQATTNNNLAPRNTQPVASKQNNSNRGWPQPQRNQASAGNLQAPLLPPPNQSPRTNSNDRYANALNSTDTNAQPVGNPNSQPRNGATGPSFPDYQTKTNPSQTANTTATSPAAPAIRAGMFSKPADAELQGANGQPVDLVRTQRQPQQAPVSNSPRGQQASNFGWDLPKTNPQSLSANNGANELRNGPGNFPLILSWVLLCSSVFGNVYLFWNYFDVRHKYRGLVHNSRDSNHRYSSFD